MRGTITRPQAQARQLNQLVSSLLCTPFINFENKSLPNDIIMIRNSREDQEGHEKRHGGGEDQQGRPSQGGGPNQTEFEAVSDSKRRPISNRVQGHLQEQPALKSSPISYMDSVFDVLYMLEKLKR